MTHEGDQSLGYWEKPGVYQPGLVTIVGGGMNMEKLPRSPVFDHIVQGVGNDFFVVVSSPSGQKEETVAYYTHAARSVGMRKEQIIPIYQPADLARIQGIPPELLTIMLTGGSQFAGKEELYGAPNDLIKAKHRRGAKIVGTSAGASLIAEMMYGVADDSDDIVSTPGLAILDDIVVEQHTNTRGRLPRLAAQMMNHRLHNNVLLGIATDENTAACVDPSLRLIHAIGTDNVYLLGCGGQEESEQEIIRNAICLKHGDFMGFDAAYRTLNFM